MPANDTSGAPSAAVSVSSVRLGRRPELLRSPAPLDEIAVLADEHRLPRLVEDFEPFDHDAVTRAAGMVALLAEHERAVRHAALEVLRRADVQAGSYAASGGQPAHAAAWESDAVNAPVADFYRATRRTLEGSWLLRRPRHHGAMPFQDAAARLLNEALQADWQAKEAVARVNPLFRASLPE